MQRCDPDSLVRRDSFWSAVNDATYFHSNWAHGQFVDLTQLVVEQYHNLFNHFPSVIVTTRDEKGDEVVVGCCMQDYLGCLAKLFVDENHRRHGIAAFIVDELSRQVEERGNVLPPHAYVEKDNDASAKLFTSLGFARWGETLAWATLVTEER